MRGLSARLVVVHPPRLSLRNAWPGQGGATSMNPASEVGSLDTDTERRIDIDHNAAGFVWDRKLSRRDSL